MVTKMKPVILTGAAMIPFIFACQFAGATDVFDVFSSFLSSIYSKILGISTAVAVVIIVGNWVYMTMVKSEKSIMTAKEWIKRAVVGWLVINGLSFIVALVQPFLTGGRFTW